MAEKLYHNHEQAEDLENSPEQQRQPAEKQETGQAEKDIQKQEALLEEARAAISHEAVDEDATKELIADNKPATRSPETSQHVNTELRELTVERQLNEIRHRLTGSQRMLSKVVHQPAVRVLSSAGSKTVSRPSGLLGGGIVALAGTTLYLLLARRIGFDYNYGVFLVLFVAGFAAGLVIEFVLKALPNSKSQA